jgi:integrase
MIRRSVPKDREPVPADGLNDKYIKEHLKPGKKPYKVWDGNGLYLVVSDTGSMFWRYKYYLNKKERTYSIGHYPAVSITEARKKRDKASGQVFEGIDPGAARKAAKAELKTSFESTALRWIASNTAWSEHYREDSVLRILKKDVFPHIGSMSLSSITPPIILGVCRRIEDRGALDVAKDTRRMIGQVFAFAMAEGGAKHNPAVGIHAALKKRKKKHFPALPRDELPEFFRKLRAIKCNRATRLSLMLQIYLGTRPGMLMNALWTDIDVKARQLRIPADRMKDEEREFKAEGDHITHLSDRALELIEELRLETGYSPYLCPGTKGAYTTMSDGAWRMLINRLGYKGKATPHGFRSTFSTTAHEVGQLNHKAIERQLDHIDDNEVSAAYNRAEYLEIRKGIMEWWSAYLVDAERASYEQEALKAA